MHTQRFRSLRSGRSTENTAEFEQHQRWLDDGGATASDLPPPLPVMWSPVALSARLEAERALESLGHRSWAICDRARTEIRRVVAMVGSRQLSLSAATEQLRDLAERLRLHRLTEESRRGPREWQLLRVRTHETPRHHTLRPADAGATVKEDE